MEKNFSPRPLLVKAYNLLQKQQIMPGAAIDFGIGVGNETTYLLQKGYDVTAVDNLQEFLTTLTKREDIAPYRSQLKIVLSNFEDLDWNTLPHVDLFVALYSLCYVQRDSFSEVFKNLIKHIKPGGYFVGQLYTHLIKNKQEGGYFIEEDIQQGDEYGLVHIPFMTKEDILELFNNFTIEYFEDAEALYDKVTKGPEDHPIYSIIARKNS